ncbi:hypothetical protein BS78_10G005200 [Paspalum vaginatum]|nr:hypothetical protein BS78_10G005200 [Paspalum vaginatum]
MGTALIPRRYRPLMAATDPSSSSALSPSPSRVWIFVTMRLHRALSYALLQVFAMALVTMVARMMVMVEVT